MKKGATEARELELALLDIVVRSCFFERQAGYTEKSIAIFQALIEYNICCPKDTMADITRLRRFQEFWESESPRVGDEGCEGWHTWLQNIKSKNYVKSKYEEVLKAKKKKKEEEMKKMQEKEEKEEQKEEEEFTVEKPMEMQTENDEEQTEKQVFFDWILEEAVLDGKEWDPCRPSKV